MAMMIWKLFCNISIQKKAPTLSGLFWHSYLIKKATPCFDKNNKIPFYFYPTKKQTSTLYKMENPDH